MDKKVGVVDSESAVKPAQVEDAGEAVENEDDTFPGDSSSGEKRPAKSLLGRRNTGNNLYIKIPSNAHPDDQ